MKKILFPIAFLCLLSACSKNQEKAEKIYNSALSRFEQGDYNLAKRDIDSIRSNYPKEFDVIRKSIRLMRKIEFQEQQRNFAYCDSMLTVYTNKSDSLKKQFQFQIDKEYDQIGRYVQKSLTLDRNLNHNYLRAEVFENGTLQLISVYNGTSPLNHNHIKVSLKDGSYAETEAIPYDGGRNYRFKDEGMYHERVTYNLKNDGGVTGFIADFKDQPINLLFIGDKKEATSLLPEQKKAIAQSVELSSYLQSMQNLIEERRLAEAKLNLLKKKEEELAKKESSEK